MNTSNLAAAARELLTPRLRLQYPRAEHAAAFVESLNHNLPELRFVGWGQHPRDLEWSLRFCENAAHAVDAGETIVFNVFERVGQAAAGASGDRHAAAIGAHIDRDAADIGAYIGRVDLHSFDFEAPRCEVGYVGDKRSAGRGLMREAVLATIELGFAIGLARIHALSDVRNERALHFAQALGMKFEGTLRAFERDPQGELADMAMFAACRPAA